jgi:hypothetical protein
VGECVYVRGLLRRSIRQSSRKKKGRLEGQGEGGDEEKHQKTTLQECKNEKTSETARVK